MESNTEKSNFYSLCLTDAGELWYGYTKDQLHGLRYYLSVMEEFISKSESEELSCLKRQSDMLCAQKQGDFWAMNYPVHWETFANNLRNSFILLLFTSLEPYITILCRDIGKATNATIELKDIKRGNLYEKSRKYLKKFGSFKLPTEKEWEVVIDIYALRNMITHNDGIIEGSNKEKRIKALMNKVTGLSDGMLSKEFCEYALTTIDNFVEALYESAMIIFRTAESDARSKLKHFQEK